MNIESQLRSRSRPFLFLLGLLLDFVLGFLDYLTGAQIGIGAFYLLPIFLVAWFIDRKAGILMSFISVATLIAASLPESHERAAMVFWNGFMHLSFFVISTLLLSRIRHTLDERDHFIAKLDRAYKDMETFSYAASHDLKSPLIVISGFSRILRDDYAGQLDEKGRDLLSRIEASAAKMSQLIIDLLSFSKVSTQEVHCADIDMEALAVKVFDELKPVIGERDIQLQVGKLPTAYGDLPMICQVLVNFLSNAIKFTKTRPTSIIVIGGSSDEKETAYSVGDNGVGFDDKSKGRLFGLFQRIHASQHFEGTGIGLFMIKRIIEKHGGRVWAEGAPDKGATFHFCLPRKEAR
jgi:light-regulated signal transduction histidine kinase (bacteriophytochrome)